MYVTFKSLYVLEKLNQTTINTDGSGDPKTKSTSVIAFLAFCIQYSFKAATWDGSPSQTPPGRN